MAMAQITRGYRPASMEKNPLFVPKRQMRYNFLLEKLVVM